MKEYNFTLTMTEDEIIDMFKYNVEYIIENQIPEDILRWVLQRQKKYLKEDEIFVKYPDWEGYYGSNYGRLISTKEKEPKLLKLLNLSEGYVGYTFSDPQKKKFPITANRMVADIFLPNFWKDWERDKLHAHHIDRNRKNNKWTNIVLEPVPLHRAMHRYEDKHGIMDEVVICVAPSKDGNLYPESIKS